MTRELEAPIPIHRRVGWRLGLMVALVVLVADLFSLAMWQSWTEAAHPEWFTPEAMRAAAETLERGGELEWMSAGDRRAWALDSVLFALALAVLTAFVVSVMATRRIRRMAQLARAPIQAEHLPGPFDASGADEVAVLARSMNAMRDRISGLLADLAARDAARRDWVAQVSHDLRTPITALGIGLERMEGLQGSSEPRDREELSELMSAARTGIGRVTALTEDLLEIARLDAGDGLRREPVPGGELLMQTVEALRPIAFARDVELVTIIPPGLPTLEADGRRLARALENLVMNSIQYCRGRVRVSAQEAHGELRYTVEDDGPGFPGGEGELELEQLALTSRRADSVGLGLQVAARVAAVHGGRLGARNLAGGGASVYLCLPVTAPAG